MNKYTFPIPANLNGEQLKAELGCDEVYIREDKLVIGGYLTEAQALAGIAAHQTTYLTEKAKKDAEKVAKKAAKSDAMAKVLNKLGVTEDEFKLIFSKE